MSGNEGYVVVVIVVFAFVVGEFRVGESVVGIECQTVVDDMPL